MNISIYTLSNHSLTHPLFAIKNSHLPLRSSPFCVVMGLLMLSTTWFPYTAGSTLSVRNYMDDVAAIAVVNTAIAFGLGSCVSISFSMYRNKGVSAH